MKVVTAARMKQLDQLTIESHGVPSLVLMERAALACVAVLRAEGFDLSAVVVVCGPGNNGGDGLAIARLLHLSGTGVAIVLVGDAGRRTEETAKQLRIAESYGLRERSLGSCARPTTIVDALLGIGGVRAPEGVFKEAIQYVNDSGAKVLAVDMPSGVAADTGEAVGVAVRADVTVTMAYAKVGLTVGAGRELAGKLVVADIGIYDEEA